MSEFESKQAKAPMKFSDILKNLFFLLIILQFAPSMLENIKKQYSNMLIPRTKIGLVEIKGILLDSARYNRYLHKYFKDKNIKAVLLKMDSPGGAAGTSAAIYNEILQLKAEHKKPIITLVENACASGGYYIASATDYIIAPGSAIVGSIGTAFPSIFKLKDFIEHYNIRSLSLKAGEYKNATNPFSAETPEERAMLQSVLDSSYTQFTGDVAKARNLPLENKDIWANGKLFTSQQALELKLIDEVGSAQNAINRIKKAADFTGEIEWVRPPKVPALAAMLGGTPPDEEGGLFNNFAQALCTAVEERFFTTNTLK